MPTLSFHHPSLGTDGVNQLREVLIICFFCCLPLLIRLHQTVEREFENRNPPCLLSVLKMPTGH